MGAVPGGEWPIPWRRVPRRHPNRRAAAGEILAVAAQVHLAADELGEQSSADLDQPRDRVMRARARRNRAAAAADITVVRTVERCTIGEQRDHGVAGAHRDDLFHLVTTRIDAHAVAAAA